MNSRPRCRILLYIRPTQQPFGLFEQERRVYDGNAFNRRKISRIKRDQVGDSAGLHEAEQLDVVRPLTAHLVRNQ